MYNSFSMKHRPDNSRECTYRCRNLTFFSAILLVSNQNNPFSNQIGSTPRYVRATEQGRNGDGYDKLCKVRPVINMAKERFSNSYKPHKHIAIDEAMIKWTGRLSFKQYLPAKPIKRSITVWMR